MHQYVHHSSSLPVLSSHVFIQFWFITLCTSALCDFNANTEQNGSDSLQKKKKKVLDAESGAQVISTLLIYQMEKQTIYHAANGCLCVDGCQLSCRGNSCKSLSIIGQTLSPISLKHICKSRYSYTVIHTRTSAGMDDFPA